MRRYINRAATLGLIALLCVLGRYCNAEAFGRFGFIQQLDLAGMRVDRDGIVAKTANAVPIAFATPSRLWKASGTSEVGQTVVLTGGPNLPRKVAANLYAPGAALFFDGTLELHLKTMSAPFLTWPEGSVATEVPTPKIGWVLVSFDALSAPILVTLPPESVGSFSLTGKPGDWTLALQGSFSGWAHLSFPFGLKEFATKTAADLGQLAQRFDRIKDLYLAPPPKLESLDLNADEDGVTATWNFNGPFMVPAPVVLAPLGGYGLKLRTGYTGTGYQTEDGPILRSIGNKLRIRFPCRHIGPGRAVSLAGNPRPVPGTVSSIDIPSIADLALEAMRGDRDSMCQPVAEGAMQDYLSGADFAMEVWTRETVSYNSANKGLDLTASYGLLQQALALTQVRPPENPFLTSVLWRSDWLTWMPFSDQTNQDVNRRAAALAVVASAMNPDPSVRLQGAMLEAGLAAERGLTVQRRRSGEVIPPEKFLESLFALRHAICGTFVPGTTTPAGAEMPFSTVRILTPVPLLGEVDAKGLALACATEAAKPFRLALALPPNTDVAADDNVTSVTTQAGLDNTLNLIITPKAAGPCKLRISPLPNNGPKAPDLPGYSELRL